MTPDLNGKWTGELVYDESFGKLANEVLFFVLEISKKGDEFRGSSVDVDGVGVNPAEARIRGFSDGGKINFVKEYKAIIETEFNSAVFNPANRKGAEMSFSGSYNSTANEFEGEWISLTDFITFNNNIPGGFRGGRWRMRKEP
ncbi:MAG: hypothetical protein V4635_17725 [Bacteroidota bacterium]